MRGTSSRYRGSARTGFQSSQSPAYGFQLGGRLAAAPATVQLACGCMARIGYQRAVPIDDAEDLQRTRRRISRGHRRRRASMGAASVHSLRWLLGPLPNNLGGRREQAEKIWQESRQVSERTIRNRMTRHFPMCTTAPSRQPIGLPKILDATTHPSNKRTAADGSMTSSTTFGSPRATSADTGATSFQAG